MNGVHENILHMRYLDPSLHKTVRFQGMLSQSYLTVQTSFKMLAFYDLLKFHLFVLLIEGGEHRWKRLNGWEIQKFSVIISWPSSSSIFWVHFNLK